MLHYNWFTNFLNCSPLSAKFLNKSKLALAGENKTTWLGLANFLASSTVSFKFSHIILPLL